MSKKHGFIEEFKTFINQGSVMDLAIGMVIGAAFSKIVSSLVNDIIMPFVSLLVGGLDFTKLEITLPNFFGGDTAAHIAYGSFLQNVVDFLVIAFSLFVVIRFLNRMNERAKANAERLAKKLGKEAEEKAAEEKAKEDKKDKDTAKADKETIKLLKEILAELKSQTPKKKK